MLILLAFYWFGVCFTSVLYASLHALRPEYTWKLVGYDRKYRTPLLCVVCWPLFYALLLREWLTRG